MERMVQFPGGGSHMMNEVREGSPSPTTLKPSPPMLFLVKYANEYRSGRSSASSSVQPLATTRTSVLRPIAGGVYSRVT
jgi:hypothetical protein